MLLLNRNMLLGLTLLIALGIGFVMQAASSEQRAKAAEAPLEVTEITMTAAPATPNLKVAMTEEAPASPPALADATATPSPAPMPVAADTDAMPAPATLDAADAVLPCGIDMTAQPGPAAMVALSLSATCLPDEKVTFHHNGMMFSELTSPEGTLDIVVPALSEKAVFIASFASGEGAVAQIDVASLKAYDRTVVQWKGNAGLGLHAREFGAAYFEDGHIHADARGTATATASGQGGMLVPLGRADLDAPLLAQVYTFPSQMAKKPGAVSLSVEAEVTAANCGQQVDAQTLEVHQSTDIKVQDLTLFMPECTTIGDFLVLKNLVEDLTIAAN